MDYITVREAAEKWGVSERRINQYCAEGRIPGAERFGGAWAIPAGAEKPGDPRKQKTQTAPPSAKQAPELFPGFMPLMNTPFCPGCCKETIARMEAGPKKDIALAEYHYFSGQAEKAMQETEGYLTAADGGIRLSACLLFAYACLTMGRIDHARNALGEIRRTLASGGETDPAARAMEAFVAFAAAVLLHLPLPEEMPPVGILSAPAAPRAAGLCPVCAGPLSLSEGGLRQQRRDGGGEPLPWERPRYPIPAIYLHLVAVMDYMSLKADGTGPDPSADRLGNRPAGRSHRRLRGAPRPAGGHAGGGHQARLAGGF